MLDEEPDLGMFLDARMPRRPHAKGGRILRLTTAVISREALAHRDAQAVADQYERAGMPDTAARIRQAIEPIRPRGRQQTTEWVELRDWLVDDVIGILRENPTRKLAELMASLSKKAPWSSYSTKALEEQWRTFWKARGFDPKTALAEIKCRIREEAK